MEVEEEKQTVVETAVTTEVTTVITTLQSFDPVVFPPTLTLAVTEKPEVIKYVVPTVFCGGDFMKIKFARVSGEARCEVRVSDASMKTDGLVLIEKLTATPMAYCVNPGHYYIGCNGPATVNVEYMEATPGNEYNVDHDLSNLPGYYKVLLLSRSGERWLSGTDVQCSSICSKRNTL